MPRSALTGSRIRERRMLAGMKQADLAQQIGISASNLNLIEHNRRRIGEGLLRRIASVLGLDPAMLSEGAEAGLIAALREAAALNEGVPLPELDRMEEFVGRFPGWAALIAGQRERLQLLERTVEAMSDRMSHDPYLSASLHEVLSAVTSVRSAATILAETEDLEPEWQARFQRNLRQDAERLTEGAGALVAYLDGSVGEDGRRLPPQEEVEAWLALRGYRLPELEDGKARPAQLAAAAGLGSASARRILQHWLERYEADARRLPLTGLLSHHAAAGGDPAAIARRTGGDLALVLRRLAVLPDDPATPGAHQAGLAICDGAGALIF
ncbi:helix-turn-helix transcriptional regulator, partial [Thioclava sp. BHET1]